MKSKLSSAPSPRGNHRVLRTLAIIGAMVSPLPAVTPGGATEPVRYIGDARINRDRHDGALPLMVGTHSYQVFRANRTNLSTGNGKGWTYNHAPNMAYWNGRFYLEFTSLPVNETDLPATAVTNRLLTTSADGKTWALPVESFPHVNVSGITGVSGISASTKSYLASRSAFYTASNGKLLMTTSVSTNAPKAVGRLVREVLNSVPATFGRTYFIRYYSHSGLSATNTSPTGISSYTSSSDTAFKSACTELLGQGFVTENWWEDELNSQGSDATTRPSDGFYDIPYAQSETGDAFTKAYWTYQRADGNRVAGWKYGLFATHTTSTGAWSAPRLARTIATSAAKSWGQKMPDNRYALAYNPTTDNGRRWPLAMISSNDGIIFDGMGVICGEVPPMRFKGVSKEFGPQYVRGIESGNGNPETGAIWLGHSINKEDMWVTRVPVAATTRVSSPVSDDFEAATTGGVVIPNWNVYSPLWAPVDVTSFDSSKRLRLQDQEPHDYAKAAKAFPEAGTVNVSLQVRPSQTNGQLDIDLATPNGFRPVRLSFGADGQFKANAGATMQNLGSYTSNAWITVSVSANCAAGTYNVTAGGLSGNGRAFAESAASLSRLELRTGDFRSTPVSTSVIYTTTDAAAPDTAVANKTFHIDNVSTAADTSGPRVVDSYADGKNRFAVIFDEPLGAASANTAANYSLSPSLAVDSAVLQGDGKTVMLTLDADVSAGTAYTVTASNVRDTSTNLVAAGTAPAFTVPAAPPASNLRMWVRADTGVTQSGGYVSTWNDQSGAGNSLTNTVAGTGSKPQVVANVLNGQPVVRFDGSDFMSRAVTGLIADKAGVFIVCKANRPAAAQFVFDTAADGQRSRHQLVQNADWLELKVDANGLAINNDSFSNNEFILASYVMAGSASYSKINAANYRAGGFSDLGDPVNNPGGYSQIPASSGSPFVLGSRHTANQGFYAGDIAEMLIYDQTPTAAQLRQVESYLMNKYFAQPGGTTQVATPTFNPPAATYASAQNVTVSTVTSGAAIRYTTNGTNPTSTTGTVYASPVSISGDTTLKAIAYKSGSTDSAVASASYIISTGGGTEVIVDNLQGTQSPASSWTGSTTIPGYYASNYYHDGNNGKGKTITFTPTLVSGVYEIYARWNADSARATNVPFAINHRNGTANLSINQQVASGTWARLGGSATYEFNAGTSGNVVIGTTGTAGFVIADAIRFVKTGELPAGGTDLLEEAFTDGGRTNGTDALDSQWYLLANATPTSAGVSDGELVIGTTSTNVAGTNPHAVTTFPATTLATGESITLAFDFKSSGVAAATGIRFGLYNSGSTNLGGDLYANPPNTGTTFQNDLGYSVFAPHQGTQAITLYSRVANSTANTLQLASGANTTVIGSQNLATATNTTATYPASLRLERTSGGYDYSVTYAGTTFSGSTAMVTTSTFDTLSIFGIEGPHAYLTLDNVKVTAGSLSGAIGSPGWRSALGLGEDGSQDLAAPAGDGVPNLLKYALNLADDASDLQVPNAKRLSDPESSLVASLSGLPAITMDPSRRMVYTYIRRLDASAKGLAYEVQWDDGLGNWSVNPLAIEATLGLDGTWERVRVTDSATPATLPRRFARLRVTAVTPNLSN